ncbi:AAA family ATPase [Chloroflexi bacterium TSY]|nr:AAA family ATPase [Chloroflexi bacterium TSY]
MPHWKLYLFGPPRLEYDGQPVELTLRKGIALLAYLAVTQQPHTRDALATLFWPESSQRKARASLRRTLHRLNQTLGTEILTVEPESIALPQSADLWLDAAAYQQLVTSHLHEESSTTGNSTERVTHLLQAAELYTDDFLAGFTLPDSPEYDDWQFFQREALRQSLAQVLEQLVIAHQKQNEYELAILHARRWLALDPLHESVHCQLMQLYALTGQQAAAIRQYQECTRILNEELGASPEEETTALYDAIRAKRFPDADKVTRADPEFAVGWQDGRVTGWRDDGKSIEPVVKVPTIPDEEITLSPSHPITQSPPPHNLPPQPTPFVGREREVAEIQQLLLDEPDCRLLTLVGPGGIGKTRLALTVATHLLDAYPHGVFFVGLASVSDPEHIVTTIAEALSLNLQGAANPKMQLLNYLREKKLLLIVDNVEHLLAGAELLSEILNYSTQLTLLATSRERLYLQEEWGYDVQGLPYPDQEVRNSYHDGKTLEAYEGVRLFLQRARRAAATFTPSTVEMASIAKICQLVDGMPLGLELAAPWIRTLSCQEIAQEIEHNLDFLRTDLRNVLARHRSLKVVFEQTWQRLSAEEQAVLSKLSVFQGGGTREAAGAVSGATLPLLSSLVDKALLRRTSSGRYDLHELIRQFAAEQLQTVPNVVEQAQDLHCAYHVGFLQQRTADLKTGRQKEAIVEITADIDNVRLAWQHALRRRDVHALKQAAEGLFHYNTYRGAIQEGEAAFQDAVAAFTQITPQNGEEILSEDIALPTEQISLVGFLLATQGWFCGYRGRQPQRGQVLLEQAMTLFEQVEQRERFKEDFVLTMLGYIFMYQGKYAEAQQFGRQGLALFSERDEPWGIIWGLLLLGISAGESGELTKARQYFQKGLAVCQQNGERTVRAFHHHNLGHSAIDHGDYIEAKRHIDESIRLHQEFGNQSGMASALRIAGQLAIAKGKYPKAVQTLQKSVDLSNDMGGTLAAAGSQIILGTAFRLQGDYEAAEHLCQESLHRSKALGHPLFNARALSVLGCLAHDRSELQQAEQFQQEALALFKQMEQEPDMAVTLNHLGQVITASDETRHREASHCFQQALELAVKHRLAPIALDLFVGIINLFGQTNHTPHSLELLSLAKHHAASTYETKENAHQKRMASTTDLATEVVSAAEAKGRSLDWQETAQHLIENLASSGQNAPQSLRHITK